MTRTPSERAEQMAADYFNGRFSTLAECLDAFAADAVRTERERIRSELAVEFDDERLRYVSVQMSRDVWDELEAAMHEGEKHDPR